MNPSVLAILEEAQATRPDMPFPVLLSMIFADYSFQDLYDMNSDNEFIGVVQEWIADNR